jgi:hypothetical protein
MSLARKIAMILSAGAILVVSVLGGMNGIDGITDDGTLLQRSVSVASVLYAALGIATGVGIILRRRWSFPLAIVWSIVVTYTGTAASVAWAEKGQPILAPLAGAFLLCVVVCALIVWCVHIVTHAQRRENHFSTQRN